MQQSEINVSSLPLVALAERKRLPNCAACYLVLEGEPVIYVGRSAIKIAWLECSAPSLIPTIK